MNWQLRHSSCGWKERDHDVAFLSVNATADISRFYKGIRPFERFVKRFPPEIQRVRILERKHPKV